MNIYTWNVNGVRAAVKKNFIQEVEASGADIFCIQETKAQDEQVDEALATLDGYHVFRTSATRKGYSGVAILTKEEPLSHSYGIGEEEHDDEGRVITLRFESFSIVNVYVPNSGSGLKRLDYRGEWDKAFAKYLSQERAKNPIIVTGDFNVAHQAIDLARPKQNYNKTSGYTQQEIDGMDLLLSTGLKDMYRELHPDTVEYTFWSTRMRAREKNVGWRIDYFLVDETITDKVEEVTIHGDIMGSDHCPVSITIQ